MPDKHTSDELLVSILAEALDILGSVDLLTTDSFPIIQEALKRLDDLHDRLGNYDSSLFPRDARRRLGEIRGVLRVAGNYLGRATDGGERADQIFRARRLKSTPGG